MSGFTGSAEQNPPDRFPYNRGFRASCPSCGETVPYEILLDLFNTPCPNCGKYAILYFWGKQEGPHVTEDLAYMFCAEGLMSEEHLENALETKRQSEPTPLIELLLSIQYVTVSELENLALKLIPAEWKDHLTGESYREFERADLQREEKKLARSEVDALYALLDQIYSGCGHAFSRMSSEELEQLLRALGGDLTAGDMRNHFGSLLLSNQVLAGDVSEPAFARQFCEVFDLEFATDVEQDPSDLLEQHGKEELAELCAVPIEEHEDIVRVAVPGHLLTLGFDSLFELDLPHKIREQIGRPLEFSIMPLSKIDEQFQDKFGREIAADTDQALKLFDRALDELGGELTSRYNTLDDEQQPVPPGQESEHPAATLRSIFQSISLPDNPSSPEQEYEDVTDVLSFWLYHERAREQVPPVLDRQALDELDTSAENQMLDSEERQPEIPDQEENEVLRLSDAFQQLRRDGEIQPDKLHLPIEILDVITELEAGTYEAIPIARAGGILWFGLANPSSHVVDELSALTGEEVRVIRANDESVKEVLVRFYGVRKGEWLPDHREEDLDNEEAFQAFLELHDLPDSNQHLRDQFPEHVARELEVVPLQMTPEDIVLACREQPAFLDEQLLHMFYRRSISYRYVSDETFQDLFDQVYPDEQEQPDPEQEPAGSVERWSRDNLEDMIGAPLSLEDIELTEQLIDRLKELKRGAPPVHVITEHDAARSLPPVNVHQGQLKIPPEELEELPGTIWTPAMETFFPVLPIKELSNSLLFASSSLDRQWFLELLGVFTDREVHVVILPKSTMDDLSRTRRGGSGADMFEREQQDAQNQPEAFSAPEYMQYRSSHLFESFHELAEENQLKKFLLLLLTYLFEHEEDALRIITEEDRCSIQRWRSSEGGEELFRIDNAHIYGLRYALQEMAGEPLSDFRTDQEASFSFLYRGKLCTVDLNVNAIQEGQELVLSSRPE